MQRLFLSILIFTIFTNGIAQKSDFLNKIDGFWGKKGFGEWVFYFSQNEVLIYQGFDLHIDRWAFQQSWVVEDTLLISLRRGDQTKMQLKVLQVSDSTISIYMDEGWAGEQKKRVDNLSDYGKLLEFNKHFPENYFPQPFRNFSFENTKTLSAIPDFLKGSWMDNEDIHILIDNEFIDINHQLWWQHNIFEFVHPATQKKYYFVMLKSSENDKLACLVLSSSGENISYKLIGASPIYESNSNVLFKESHRISSDAVELEDICENIVGKYFYELDKLYTDIKDGEKIFIQGNTWEILSIKNNVSLPKSDFFEETKEEQFDLYALYLSRWDEGQKKLEKVFIKHKQDQTILMRIVGVIYGSKGQPLPFIESYYKRLHFLPEALKMFGIFVVVLLILAFIFYRSVLLPRRLQYRLTHTRLQGVKAQLNPHFLFNSMASIQSLMNQKRTEDANRYLVELSDLLRYHLDEGSDDLVLLSEELAAIKHYCTLEALRSPFNLQISVHENIRIHNFEIPGQLLQPLVENAIKHGLRHTIAPQLNILISKTENELIIIIEDNGPGIYHKQIVGVHSSRTTHQGLSLVKEKIKLMKKQGLDIQLEIKDINHDLHQERQGTQVKLVFPQIMS